MRPAGRRILVVDDERALLEAFASLMRRFRYEAEFFSDPARAVEAIALDPAAWGLVITDMRMPGLDGLAFVKAVRSLVPGLPVVFMTGFATDELKAAANRLGKVVFLEKPFEFEKVFKETIPGLLGG
jgi:DNA-binding NtrC family response regulator